MTDMVRGIGGSRWWGGREMLVAREGGIGLLWWVGHFHIFHQFLGLNLLRFLLQNTPRLHQLGRWGGGAPAAAYNEHNLLGPQHNLPTPDTHVSCSLTLHILGMAFSEPVLVVVAAVSNKPPPHSRLHQP